MREFSGTRRMQGRSHTSPLLGSTCTAIVELPATEMESEKTIAVKLVVPAAQLLNTMDTTLLSDNIAER